MKYLILILILISIGFSQSYITIPDKNAGDSFTAAELNQILDALKDGTLSINTASATIDGIDYTIVATPSDVGDSLTNPKQSIAKHDTVFDAYPYYTNLNGLEEVDPDTILTLTTIGDYVEITIRINNAAQVGTNTLGAIGEKGTSDNCFGIYNNKFSVGWRPDGEAVHIWASVLDADDTFLAFHTLKVIRETEGWNLYVNGDSAGVYAYTNPFIINNIGQAYSTLHAYVDLYDIEIYTDANGLYNLYNPVLVADNSEGRIETIVNPLDLYPCYVTYYPDGFNNLKQFYIYLRYGQTDTYFRYEVVNDSSTSAYKDIFRLYTCALFRYINGEMVDFSTELITTGENECVYKEQGQVEPVGGTHGDELYSEVYFFIDEIELTTTQLADTFLLYPCEEFKYYQVSTIYEDADVTHTPQATHHKQTVFKDNSYETFNRLIWLEILNITYWYSGLSSVDDALEGTLYSDNFGVITIVDSSDGTYLEEVGANTMYYSNNVDGLGCTVYGELLKHGTSIITDDSCTQSVTKSAANHYTKYYRTTGFFVSVIGEVWEAKLKNQFFKKED